MSLRTAAESVRPGRYGSYDCVAQISTTDATLDTTPNTLMPRIVTADVRLTETLAAVVLTAVIFGVMMSVPPSSTDTLITGLAENADGYVKV